MSKVRSEKTVTCNVTFTGSFIKLHTSLIHIISKLSTVFPRQAEVKRIVERCMLIREILRERLRLLGTPGCWDHLTQQGGLYCCAGLNGEKKTIHVALLIMYFSNLEQQMIHTSL